MKQKLLLFLILTVIGAIVYGNSINGAFQYDDSHTIENNPFIKNISFAAQYFKDGRTSSAFPENSGYRPLSTLTFAVCWWIGSGETWPFHLLKIVEHILVAWLIFLISTNLLRESPFLSNQISFLFGRKKKINLTPETISFFGALIFLVHPAFSETVNYISSTSSLQCALFFLLAFLCYLNQQAILLVIFFVLSVLTKEEGITLPAVIIAHALIFKDPTELWTSFFRRNFKVFLVSTATGIALLITYFTMRPASGAGSTLGVDRLSYFYTQVYAWNYYIAWLFAPWGYSIEHTQFGFSSSIFTPRVIFGIFSTLVFLFVAALASLRWRGRHRKTFPAFGFAIVWYFVTILPASSVFVLTEPINEHRYYLAMTLFIPGVFYAALLALERLHFVAVEWNYGGLQRATVLLRDNWRSLLFSVVYTVSILLFCILTISRNLVWKSPMAMWKDVIEKDPRNGRAHNNLGVIYLSKSENKEALDQFLKCSEYWQNYKYCYLNQYLAYSALSQIGEAKQALDRAISLDPNLVVGLWYKARHELEVDKNPQGALDTVARCEKNSGGKYTPCIRVGSKAAGQLGQFERAHQFIDRALSVEPLNRELKFEKGMLYISEQKLNDAYSYFLILVKENEQDVQALYNVAWIDQQQGRYPLAKERWQKVIEYSPASEGAWANLKNVATQLNDQGLVERCTQELHRLNPQVY